MSRRLLLLSLVISGFLLGVGVAAVEFALGGPAAVILLVGILTVMLVQLGRLTGRPRHASGLSLNRVSRAGTRGIDKGPRARVEQWAALPEPEATWAIRTWMEAIADLPEAWGVQALHMVALAIHYLPEGQQERLMEMRLQALSAVPPRRRNILRQLYARLMRQLPGSVRYRELELLQALDSLSS